MYKRQGLFWPRSWRIFPWRAGRPWTAARPPRTIDVYKRQVSDVGAWFGRMESGDFRTYIVYIVGALVFFLALIILVR